MLVNTLTCRAYMQNEELDPNGIRERLFRGSWDDYVNEAVNDVFHHPWDEGALQDEASYEKQWMHDRRSPHFQTYGFTYLHSWSEPDSDDEDNDEKESDEEDSNQTRIMTAAEHSAVALHHIQEAWLDANGCFDHDTGCRPQVPYKKSRDPPGYIGQLTGRRLKRRTWNPNDAVVVRLLKQLPSFTFALKIVNCK